MFHYFARAFAITRLISAAACHDAADEGAAPPCRVIAYFRCHAAFSFAYAAASRR